MKTGERVNEMAPLDTTFGEELIQCAPYCRKLRCVGLCPICGRDCFVTCESSRSRNRDLQKVYYLIKIGAEKLLDTLFENQCIFGNMF